MPEHKCYFEGEEFCPLKLTGMTCEACTARSYPKIINEAVEDYEKLGVSFSKFFKFFNSLLEHPEKGVNVKIPTDSIFTINRVIVALFNDKAERAPEEIVYRRLIYFCFRVMVEEFEIEEYREAKVVH